MKEFGPIHPRDINYHHIRRLRNTITNLKQRTIRTYLNRLGKMLEFFYGVNPYHQADVLWFPEATERDWIFKAQWKELWNRADETERLILALGGGMGLRRSEIADIKNSDISGNVLSVRGKGSGPNGKAVTMQIPPTVMRCIDDYFVVRSSIIGEDDISDGNMLVMSRKRKGSSATSRSRRNDTPTSLGQDRNPRYLPYAAQVLLHGDGGRGNGDRYRPQDGVPRTHHNDIRQLRVCRP